MKPQLQYFYGITVSRMSYNWPSSHFYLTVFFYIHTDTFVGTAILAKASQNQWQAIIIETKATVPPSEHYKFISSHHKVIFSPTMDWFLELHIINRTNVKPTHEMWLFHFRLCIYSIKSLILYLVSLIATLFFKFVLSFH